MKIVSVEKIIREDKKAYKIDLYFEAGEMVDLMRVFGKNVNSGLESILTFYQYFNFENLIEKTVKFTISEKELDELIEKLEEYNVDYELLKKELSKDKKEEEEKATKLTNNIDLLMKENNARKEVLKKYGDFTLHYRQIYFNNDEFIIRMFENFSDDFKVFNNSLSEEEKEKYIENVPKLHKATEEEILKEAEELQNKIEEVKIQIRESEKIAKRKTLELKEEYYYLEIEPMYNNISVIIKHRVNTGSKFDLKNIENENFYKTLEEAEVIADKISK